MLTAERAPAPSRAAPVAETFRRPRLRGHVLLYALLLVALAPFMRLAGSWSVDEGLYALQVQALQEGSWEFDYWAEDIDPERRWFPLTNAEQGPDAVFPYVRSPGYVKLLQATSAAFGDTVGLHVLGLLGALGAAVAAWLLAGRIDRRVAPAAFWMVALGPVVLNAYAIFAHAPSTGVAGFTAYLALRVWQDGPRPWVVTGLCAGTAAGVLLRSEGLVFAGALVLAFGGAGFVRLVRRTPGAWRAGGVAMAVGIVALGVNAAEGRWATAIVGRFTTNDQVRGGGSNFFVGKLQGAHHILFEGAHFTQSRAFITLALVATVAAGVALRRGGRDGWAVAAWASAVSAGAMTLQFAVAGPDLVPGIVAAWPVLAVSLVCVSWRVFSPGERILAAVAAIGLGATLATQYAEGGGFEWGGRYLSPLYPILAVLAAVALRRTLAGAPDAARRRLVAGLALLAVVPAVGGLVEGYGIRRDLDQEIVAVEAHPGVVVTSRPFLAQGAYRTFPERRWLKVPPAEIPEALQVLARAGYDDVVLTDPPADWSRGMETPGGYHVVDTFAGGIALGR